jgi:protein-S-isoprenylcysteine O-methyltransferase Ste14
MSGALRPALGTVIFGLVVVGPIVALVPWIVTGWVIQEPLFDGETSRWIGAVLFLIGLPIWGSAALRFVRQGRGTPAPVAPPEHLVVTGLYRYVRNPMYVGVLAMIFGQALFLGSRGSLIYGLCMAIGFHLFIVLYEEPALRAKFGAEYVAYCTRVRRWLPALPRSD